MPVGGMGITPQLQHQCWYSGGMERIKRRIVFEHVDAEDLLDVARSMRGRGREDVRIPAPGIGVDELLAWSLKDVELARDVRGTSAEGRCATNAVMNGRRALACLIDWYLQRDCFHLCADAPQGAEKKAEVLQERGILDPTAVSALKRAIFERDKAEHQFKAVTLEEAESFVEMMRSSISRLRAESDPSLTPFCFGGMSYSFIRRGYSSTVTFLGWMESSFFFCSWVQDPWLGAIVRDENDHFAATVRRGFFKEITTDLLLKVLQALELSYGQSGGSMSLEIGKKILQESGIAT